jgi:hypothetical protein
MKVLAEVSLDKEDAVQSPPVITVNGINQQKSSAMVKEGDTIMLYVCGPKEYQSSVTATLRYGGQEETVDITTGRAPPPSPPSPPPPPPSPPPPLPPPPPIGDGWYLESHCKPEREYAFKQVVHNGGAGARLARARDLGKGPQNSNDAREEIKYNIFQYASQTSLHQEVDTRRHLLAPSSHEHHVQSRIFTVHGPDLGGGAVQVVNPAAP